MLQRVVSCSADLTDVQFSMLREAVREGNASMQSIEKKIARAKRQLDRAEQILKRAFDGEQSDGWVEE